MRIEWKGGKLTKKRAAFLCAELWTWVADTLTQAKWEEWSRIKWYKSQWPGWKNNGGKVAACLFFCPACQESAHDCEKCILEVIWGKGDNGPCMENKPSPYNKLDGLARSRNLKTAKAVKRRARIVAEAARKIYEEAE